MLAATTLATIAAGEALGLAASYPFLLGIAYESARNDRQMTFRKSGAFKFIEEGGVIVGIIYDTPGKRHDWDSDTMIDVPVPAKPSVIAKSVNKSMRTRGMGEKHSGLAWVSIKYPIRHVAEWDFGWPKFEAKTGGEIEKGKLLEKYEIIQRQEKVKELYYKAYYPLLVTDIELQGNVTINVIVILTFTIEKPLYLIATLKGKFMQAALAQAAGILNNGLRSFSVKSWRETNRVEAINDLFKGKAIVDGAISVSAEYKDYDYEGNSAQTFDAISAQERQVMLAEANLAQAKKDAETTVVNAEAAAKKKVIEAEAEAKATVATAEADKTARVLDGQAESERLKNIISQIKEHPQGADMYMTEQLSGAIRDYKGGGALVLGDAGKVLVGGGAK